MHRVLRFRTKIYSLNLYLDYQRVFQSLKYIIHGSSEKITKNKISRKKIKKS